MFFGVALRGLARETELAASHLVYPMFVVAGGEKRAPIASLPGLDHRSIDGAVEPCATIPGTIRRAVDCFGTRLDRSST